jgi:NAD(P)-dependent dehydrogenase (short-subunit alcohol dehydrogenase family)
MDVNLTGTFNLTRIACKHLVKVSPEGPDGERGVIVMVASSAAVRPIFAPPFFLCVLLISYSHPLSSKANLARWRMPPLKVR